MESETNTTRERVKKMMTIGNQLEDLYDPKLRDANKGENTNKVVGRKYLY